MNKQKFQFEIDDKIYQIIGIIGQGGFAKVYKVYDQQDTKYLALKIITNQIQYEQELKFYQHFQNLENELLEIPQLYYAGKYKASNREKYYLILDLLGPSFISLIIRNNYKFSQIEEIAYVGYQVLKQIEQLHKEEYFHRDIKVDNILFKSEDVDLTDLRYEDICLIDFGFAIPVDEYLNSVPDESMNELIKFSQRCGNYHFMGLRYQKGNKFSFIDDIESWFYSIIYFAQGHLPWTLNFKNKNQDIIRMKEQNYQTQGMCHSLPIQFKQIFDIIINHQNGQLPDYNSIYDLLNEIKKYDSIPDYLVKNYNVVIEPRFQLIDSNQKNLVNIESSIINLSLILQNSSKQITPQSKNSHLQMQEEKKMIGDNILNNISQKQPVIDDIFKNNKYIHMKSNNNLKCYIKLEDDSEFKIQSCLHLDNYEILEDLNEFQGDQPFHLQKSIFPHKSSFAEKK